MNLQAGAGPFQARRRSAGAARGGLRESSRRPPAVLRRRAKLLAAWWVATVLSVLVSGCTAISFRREPPRPGRTTLGTPLVILPAQNIGNHLLVEARWDRNGPYRFLVDTGSSVTLVSPELVRRYAGRRLPPAGAPRIRVAGADGVITELPSASLRRIELGDARFEEVPVVVYDSEPLSAHLGVKIDGVLGYPLFRETLLTLDYLGVRVILQPAKSDALMPGTVLALDQTRKTPVIPLRLGDRTLLALIDSGSDAAFSLNPKGLELEFAVPPRPGATIGTLSGDRRERVGRLAQPLAIGTHVFEQPIVDLTDELSAIGGAALRHFTITFDQERDRVAFYRDSREPMVMPPLRSAGLSFSKTPAYWRVAGVVPASPAAHRGVQVGDLVTRINGEPVGRWDFQRYQQLVATAGEITFAFLQGNSEVERRVRVFELVP
jgi:hypothetical protein